MTILQTLQQLRDDLKSWVTTNLNALNAKIDEKTVIIDNKLDSTSTNPVQNKVIATEIDDINKRIGDTSVTTQISNAIAKQSHFSGDYNDLTNAPNITEDDSGNIIIADESGNVIFKVDAEGMHTTVITLNGEAAATEKYVDNAIANIDFPETDISGKADIEHKHVIEDITDFPTNLATIDDVNNAIANFIEADPVALEALQELSQALENHEDAYDALL